MKMKSSPMEKTMMEKKMEMKSEKNAEGKMPSKGKLSKGKKVIAMSKKGRPRAMKY